MHVLCVDDDSSLVSLVAEMLERREPDLVVTTATDAGEGLEVLRTADPPVECVVSDYRMPEVDGLAFLEQVRAEWDVPFVLYTGDGDEAVASEAISAGVTDYLHKRTGTAQYDLLANRVRNAVERRRREAEVERRAVALETAREGICIVSVDGRFEYANGAYLDLYGYTEEELLGQPWEVLHPAEEVARVEANVLPVVEREGEWRGTAVGLREDGTTFPESKSVALLPDGGLVVVVVDPTDLSALALAETTVEEAIDGDGSDSSAPTSSD
jgi:PAS domain S-box-containing protein